MFRRIVLILLLAAVAQARGATETQGALVLVKWSVILNGEGGPGVTNVLITDSAHTGGPWATGSDGGFTLEYPDRAPGERVRLGVIKEGYVVVNWVQLDLPRGCRRRCFVILSREIVNGQPDETEEGV